MRRASDRRTLISLSKAVVAAGALLALLAVACGDDGETTSMEQQTPQAETAAPTAAPKPKSYDSPPPMTIDPNKQYTATIVLEKGGEIVIELFAKETPMTVNNFVFLARDGYYDGVTFHRVLPGFMAQTGDPTGTGSGGPGYRFEDEFHPDRRHDGPGVLSMANAGENTNGSQFFITFTATPQLDFVHSVFGRVTSGMEVVEGITLRRPGEATTPGDAMKTIRIEEE